MAAAAGKKGEAGAAMPLVLLPGMMCDGRLFGPQIEALGGARTITVADLSGSDTVTAMAERVLAAAPGRFALAGLSMGGIVAMEVVRLAPDRIERLALLDTNHRADPPERRPVRDRQIAEAREGRLRAVIVEEMKPNYLGPSSRSDQALLDLLIEMALDLGPATFVSQSASLRDRPDQTETLKALACPVLLLCGRHDGLCPPSRHEEMAALIPGARLSVIEDAGHLPPLEQPDEVTGLIRDWLEDNRR